MFFCGEFMQNGDLSKLDQIRLNDGNDKCRKFLEHTFYRNGKEAVELINDDNLSFPTFYALLHLIRVFGLARYLDKKKSIALDIINQIILPRGFYRGREYLSMKDQSVYETLLWMANTGKEEDIDNQYEHVMDVAISVLIDTYEDKDILEAVDEMIFKRNAKGRYINDLVWAFFNSKDPKTIKLLLKRLRSDNPNESQLAQKLLNIEEDIVSKENFCAEYSQWLEENGEFIYFTEESNQYASNPVLLKEDLARKYFNKGVKDYRHQPYVPLSAQEAECLAAFNALNDDDKAILSEYSKKKRDKSQAEWKDWINKPIEEQIKEALGRGEEYI